MSFLNQECNEKVTIERQNTSRYENVPALISGEVIIIPDAQIPIESGDAILRQLPSGLVDRLIVIDPGFQAEIFGISAYYQIKYRREGQQPAGNPDYQIHVSGDNSRVNIGSTDNSINAVNTVKNEPCDFTALADELVRLRTALLEKAQSPEHYIAIGAVASAEKETESGDVSKVNRALSALGGAGRWVLTTAKEIGVPLVIELLKAKLSLTPDK